MLKIPFDSVDDKEQQNELIDIARLVLHHNKNDNKILNDNESQYADPDDTQNYLKNWLETFYSFKFFLKFKIENPLFLF